MPKRKPDTTTADFIAAELARYSNEDLATMIRKIDTEIADLREPLLALFKEAVNCANMQYILRKELFRRGASHSPSPSASVTVEEAKARGRAMK